MKLIGRREVSRVAGLSSRRIADLLRSGDFPPPTLRLGPGPGRGDRWDRAVVVAWAAKRPRQRRAVGEAAPKCSAKDCGRDAVARGLCLKHWRRHRATGTVDGPQGRVEVDGEGRLICAVCGSPWWSLAAHVAAHGLTAAGYREACDLAPSTPLIAASRRQQMSDDARARIGTTAWESFEAARNPEKAAATRDGGTWDKISQTKRAGK